MDNQEIKNCWNNENTSEARRERGFVAKKQKPMDNPYLVELGQNIQRQREFLGMSQETLALELGTGKETISRYESAQVIMKVDRFFELAEALYVTPTELSPKQLCIQQDIDPRLFQIGEQVKKLSPQLQAEAFRAMEALIVGLKSMG